MIKTIRASTLRSDFKDALDHIKKTKQPLIITERGTPTSVLITIDEYEDQLASYDATLAAEVKNARGEYKRGEVFTFDDVFGKVE